MPEQCWTALQQALRPPPSTSISPSSFLRSREHSAGGAGRSRGGARGCSTGSSGGRCFGELQ